MPRLLSTPYTRAILLHIEGTTEFSPRVPEPYPILHKHASFHAILQDAAATNPAVGCGDLIHC